MNNGDPFTDIYVSRLQSVETYRTSQPKISNTEDIDAGHKT